LGEGIFNADPLFVNADSGDYHLLLESPLIDAGSPLSARDPDGSRSDIGVFPFDWTPVEEEKQGETGIPACFTVVGPYPNPFNEKCVVRVSLAVAENVSIVIYDILGRCVKRQRFSHLSTGLNDMNLSFSDQPSGIYFVLVATATEKSLLKTLLIK
jgi:hypothetical protein